MQPEHTSSIQDTLQTFVVNYNDLRQQHGHETQATTLIDDFSNMLCTDQRVGSLSLDEKLGYAHILADWAITAKTNLTACEALDGLSRFIQSDNVAPLEKPSFEACYADISEKAQNTMVRGEAVAAYQDGYSAYSLQKKRNRDGVLAAG